jgi:hypothetical protein
MNSVEMDAIGAQHLSRDIAQQQHWRKATAVREGRQAGRDPDASNLVEFDEALRRYRGRDGRTYEKHLLDGAWV